MLPNIFNLQEFLPKIFLVKFYKLHHLALVFLRFNESYEHPALGGGAFSLLKFLDYEISQNEESNLSYFADWDGFCLSSKDVEAVIKEGIKDPNEGDVLFLSIFSICKTYYPDEEFIIIGLDNNIDQSVLDHELAHAFFTLDEKYRKAMVKLYNNLNPEIQDRLLQILGGWGYVNQYWDDETQAYLATNLLEYDEFKILAQDFDLDKASEPFKELFLKTKDQNFQAKMLLPYIET